MILGLPTEYFVATVLGLIGLALILVGMNLLWLRWRKPFRGKTIDEIVRDDERERARRESRKAETTNSRG
jgi:hypothetical protein